MLNKITAKKVKRLRDETGAGMIDCKLALKYCDGNIVNAYCYLKFNGLAIYIKNRKDWLDSNIKECSQNTNIIKLFNDYIDD